MSKWDLLRMFPTWKFCQSKSGVGVLMATAVCVGEKNTLVEMGFWYDGDNTLFAYNFFLN